VNSSFFQPGRGPLHRFDPRCKLPLAVLFTVLFFLPLRLPLLAAYLGAVSLTLWLFLGFRELLRPLRTIAPLLLLVLLLTPPFRRGGQVYLSVGGLALLSAVGLREAAVLALRLTGITFTFFALLRSTEAADLILALRAFGLPFAAGLVVSLALQYMPGLRGLYAQVQDAHRLRRAEDSAPAARGPAAKRPAAKGLKAARALIPQLTSVLILSVRRIPVLAMALELRGVGLKTRRTSLRRLPGGRRLAWSLLAALLAGGAAAAVAVLFH
jgi:energy-coupling factor transport system permease protein